MLDKQHHRWYVIHTYSGFEEKAAEAIREQAKRSDCAELFDELLVPSQTIQKIVKGAKKEKKIATFPGYVLAHMTLTDETWHLVKNTSHVSGFLGPSGQPTPMSKKDVETMIAQSHKAASEHVLMFQFKEGDMVRVLEGPFKDFEGVIDSVDQERKRLHITMSVFGRKTPVDLDFGQVEHVK